MVNSPIDYVIEAIKAGKNIIDIIRGLRGKKISTEERGYIDWLMRNYDTERIINGLSREYREGTERVSKEQRTGFENVANHLTSLEKSIEKYYGKIEGLIEGLLLGGYRTKKRGGK